MLLPHRLAIALQEDGWIVRNDVIWWKRNAMPEPVAGWRWESKSCDCMTERREAMIAANIDKGIERLTQLAERAAQLHRIPALRDLTPLDVSVVYGNSDLEETGEYPIIKLGWEGGVDIAGLPADEMMALRPDAMQDVGHVLTLILGMMAREPIY